MELARIAGVDCKMGDDCPAVFMTDRGTIAVQGYAVNRKTPDGEAVVEVPTKLL